ncbi:MAG: hypothetical protein C0596_19155 [Marinilabiliales bacterium]|nr:MAG: hypothetical protein C0596_19155 [Marinilabiliales bacterium]
MKKVENYQKTDVSIFKKIFERKFFCKTKNINERKVKDYIRELYLEEISYPGLELDVQKEISKLNLQEYGFNSIDDVDIEIKKYVFNESTSIILRPKTFFENGERFGIPQYDHFEKELFIMFLGDTFERLKIKAENIIHTCVCDKHIEFYAKKNIQVLSSSFDDANNYMNEICIREDNLKFFRVYVLNTYIYNSLMFYQNRFNEFYLEEKHLINDMRMKLVNSIGIHTIIEPLFSNKCDELDNEFIKDFEPIPWNGQTNVLVTLFYDFLKEKRIKTNIKNVVLLIYWCFRDKNGKRISKLTIETILKDYRSEKRASGNKRIDLGRFDNFDD